MAASRTGRPWSSAGCTATGPILLHLNRHRVDRDDDDVPDPPGPWVDAHLMDSSVVAFGRRFADAAAARCHSLVAGQRGYLDPLADWGGPHLQADSVLGAQRRGWPSLARAGTRGSGAVCRWDCGWCFLEGERLTPRDTAVPWATPPPWPTCDDPAVTRTPPDLQAPAPAPSDRSALGDDDDDGKGGVGERSGRKERVLRSATVPVDSLRDRVSMHQVAANKTQCTNMFPRNVLSLRSGTCFASVSTGMFRGC